MLRSEMTIPKILLVMVVIFPLACDWFESQPEANLPPETRILECGASQEVVEGEDVRFRWAGSDFDGSVVRFEVSYDEGPWEATPSDSMTIPDITRGEHVFRVRAVDDDGEADPDPAECRFTALAAGAPVERRVLVELFTTNECPNCPKAETALNALVADIGAETVSVVAYHDKPSYSPDSDPLATDGTDERIAWYTDDPAFPGDEDTWPTVVFDGLRVVVGAATATEAEALYRLETTARAETASPFSLRLEGEIGEEQGSLRVTVKAEDGPPEGSLVLRTVLIENDVKYRGYWATRFDYVARRLLDEEPIDLGAPGDSAVVERTFPVDPFWVVENLDLVAFVQDSATMEVFQSGRFGGN